MLDCWTVPSRVDIDISHNKQMLSDSLLFPMLDALHRPCLIPMPMTRFFAFRNDDIHDGTGVVTVVKIMVSFSLTWRCGTTPARFIETRAGAGSLALPDVDSLQYWHRSWDSILEG